MTDKMTDAARRTRGYWFVDGLAEIGGGILSIVVGVPYLLWSLAPQGSRLARVASGGRDVILLVGIALLFVIIRMIKQRSTYPRSGYIEERQPERKKTLKTILLIFGCLIVFPFLLIVGFRFFPNFRIGFLNTMFFFPTILGLFFTLGLVVWGFRAGIKRFYVLAGVAALTSLGLLSVSLPVLVKNPFKLSYFSSMSINAQMPAEAASALLNLFRNVTTGAGIFLAVFGLAMLVSGLITRRQYLLKNPPSINLEQEVGE
jgi:hypothetical protein